MRFGKSMRDQCLKVSAEIRHRDPRTRRPIGPRDNDMTAQLTNIKGKAGVQAVLNPGFGQGPAIVTRNYKQLGMSRCRSTRATASPRSSSSSLRRRPRRKACGCRPRRCWSADKLPDSDPQKKVVVDYKKTYEDKTGSRSRPSAATPMTA